MTQDEIIEMAREAGFYNHTPMYFDDEMLVAFANLVAAKATEEANARANASWTLMCKKMVAIEREACAVLAQKTVCDTHIPTGVKIIRYGTGIAKAIRARGEQA